MINLDYYCMEHAQKLPKDKDAENVIRKALGVLQEDGVYAMFLWLEEKNKEIREKLVGFLNESKVKSYLIDNQDKFSDDFKKLCRQLSGVAGDIDKLFFMRKILGRTLDYALYHAKIKQENR